MQFWLPTYRRFWLHKLKVYQPRVTWWNHPRRFLLLLKIWNDVRFLYGQPSPILHLLLHIYLKNAGRVLILVAYLQAFLIPCQPRLTWWVLPRKILSLLEMWNDYRRFWSHELKECQPRLTWWILPRKILSLLEMWNDIIYISALKKAPKNNRNYVKWKFKTKLLNGTLNS